MTDAGFFKGTSTDQDSRFADKKKKLMKSMKFGVNLNQKIDILKVNVDTIKPWIVKRITELLTYEDDIVYEYALNMLSEQFPDPKDIQINLTAFLGSKNARIFVTELWDLLLSAMTTPGGAPAILLEAKKAELLETKKSEEKIRAELSRTLAVTSASLESKPTPIPARDSRRERRRYTSSPDNDRSQRENPPVTSRFREGRRHERQHSRSRYSRSSSRRHRKDRRDRRPYDDDGYFDDRRRRDRRERRRSPDVNEEDGREKRNTDGPICVPQEFGVTSPARLKEETVTASVARDLPVERNDTSATSEQPLASSPTPPSKIPDTVEEPELKRRRKDDRELEAPVGRQHRDKDEYIEESSRRSGARSPQEERYAEERRRGDVRKSDEARHRDRHANYADEHRFSRQRPFDQSPPERDFPRAPYRSSYRLQDDDHRRAPFEGRRRDNGAVGGEQRGRHNNPGKRDRNYAGFWEEERSNSRRSRDVQRERRYSPEGPSVPPAQRKKRSPEQQDILPSPEGPALPHDAPVLPEGPRSTAVKAKTAPSTKDKHRSLSSTSSSDTSGSSTESDTDSSSSNSSSDSSRSSSSSSSDDNEDVPRKKPKSGPFDRHKGRVKKDESQPKSSRRERSPVDRRISTKTFPVEQYLEKKDKQQKKISGRKISETRDPSLPPEGPSLPDVADLPPTEWHENQQSPDQKPHRTKAASSSSTASSDSSATDSSSDDDDASSTSGSGSSSGSSTSLEVKKGGKGRSKQQQSSIVKKSIDSGRGDEAKKHPRVGDKEDSRRRESVGEREHERHRRRVSEKPVESLSPQLPSVQGDLDGDEDRLRRQALESLKRRRRGSDAGASDK